MSEVYPTDNSLLNLVHEEETGVEYIETGKAPYYVEFRKLLYRLLLATRRANDLRVFDEGGLEIGVKAGKFWDGMAVRTYAGSTSNALADNKAHIYIYIDASGTLVITEYTGWPDEAVNHIRLADVTTSGGDITNVTDARDHHVYFNPASVIGNYNNTHGGTTFILKATITAGADVDIYNNDAPCKLRVLDAWSVAQSADGGSWKLTDGTNDVTDTVTVTGTDKTIDRISTLDDEYHEIVASGSLVVDADGSNADCEVYVLCMRVA